MAPGNPQGSVFASNAKAKWVPTFASNWEPAGPVDLGLDLEILLSSVTRYWSRDLRSMPDMRIEPQAYVHAEREASITVERPLLCFVDALLHPQRISAFRPKSHGLVNAADPGKYLPLRRQFPPDSGRFRQPPNPDDKNMRLRLMHYSRTLNPRSHQLWRLSPSRDKNPVQCIRVSVQSTSHNPRIQRKNPAPTCNGEWPSEGKWRRGRA